MLASVESIFQTLNVCNTILLQVLAVLFGWLKGKHDWQLDFMDRLACLGALNLMSGQRHKDEATVFVVLVFAVCHLAYYSIKGCSAYGQLCSGPVNWAAITWLTTIMSNGLTHRPKLEHVHI